MKKLFSILSVACLMLFPSCNDWLNVTPQGQIEAEDLYETTKGCNSVVGGIYYTLSGSNLFGQTLSFGLIDILAQYYDLSTHTDHQYYRASLYDYEDTNITGTFGTVWQNLYQTITQCNAFIYYSDPYKENISNYDLLLGEVYGLRALAHMELFEIFGPVIHTTADLQKPAVAYRTEYNNISQGFDTGEVVLQKAAEDLNRALELLADDPIRDPNVGRDGDLNNSVLDYQDVLNYRGARMNYFCALGLMARLEMLRQNKDAAYTYATRVMEETDGIISLMETQDMTGSENSRIYNFAKEMLGSFYVNNLYDITDTYFGMGGGVTSIDQSAMVIDEERHSDLISRIYAPSGAVDGSANDMRTLWFSWNQENSNYDFMKYKQAEPRQGLSEAYFPEISIMRLSEIYYIACEAQIGRDNTLALEYLNTVRTSRRLEPLSGGPYTDEQMMTYLVNDARKDFIGEGRMFFMYKRLFRDFTNMRGQTVTANDNIFVLPIPDDEYEYANIERPGTGASQN